MVHARRVRSLVVAGLGLASLPAMAARPYPILFVTQTPNPADFGTVAATFGNHSPAISSAPRGGDLWILYPDDTLKNLTRAAGYGAPGAGEPGETTGGFQGAGAIAVREPAVHWSGAKALFSMVVGAPTQQYQTPTFRWQLYEVTGLGPADTPVVTKVANQPEAFNNVSPVYLSDGRILFTSDRPFNGAAHLYPQRDEYESSPVVSGLWVLDSASGELVLYDHSPSGNFKPIVDSFGRIVFTRWDHLQRDQQADPDRKAISLGNPTIYGTFDYASEAPGAAALDERSELFPEPRQTGTPAPVPPENGLTVNQFFPWMLNQDGSELETLNHIGRHELISYFEFSRTDDANLEIFSCGQNACGRFNPNDVLSLFQIRESVETPGDFVGVDAPEFGTHAMGRIVKLPGGPTKLGDEMAITYLTHPSTGSFDDTPPPCHSGLYRSPLPLSDGSLVAVHAGERSAGVPETRDDANGGTAAAPASRYKLRLVELVDTLDACSGYLRYGAALTPGIVKTFWYWSPDWRVDFVGVTMWELDPVEVRPTEAPPATGAPPLPAPEASVFADEAVDPSLFAADLAARGLALVVSRDVTTRDVADRQQPFNLRVPGGTAETLGASGTVYDVEYLQFLQGDMIRGIGGHYSPPSPGRRVLARALHDPAAWNPPLDPGDPPGSVEVAGDGSMAALVPARRAMTWQLTDGGGAPVVRERYWLTFQPGELRVCTSCHGLNREDQAGHGVPANPPEALRGLLRWWKGLIFRDDFEVGSTARWSADLP
jgi:hypothetical protein